MPRQLSKESYSNNWEQTAVIDEGAKIDNTAYVAHFSYIMASAVIEPWCIIGAYVFVGDNVILGEGVKIMSHTTLTDCEIGKDAFIGPGVRVLNVKMPRTDKQIPDVDPVSIGEGAIIGGGSVILPGITIGPRALVAAGAIVSKDLPAGTMAKGQAAQVIEYGVIDRCIQERNS